MKRVVTGMLLLISVSGIAFAHVGSHPSVHDTVAGIVMRMQRNLPAEDLTGITVPEVLDFLLEEERDVLATQHLIFNVNVPVVLHLYRQKTQDEVVYWLEDRGFAKTPLEVSVGGELFEVWRKEFDAGEIGLGVNSVSGNGDHYFVSLAPQDAGDTVEVTNIYPGLHTLGTMQKDERTYISWDDRVLTALPSELEGEILLRGDPNKRRTAKLIDIYRITPYPAAANPDHVVLTWSDDPKTTQAIQWRTSIEVNEGVVRYRPKGSDEEWTTVAADSEMLVNYNTVNDPLCLRHTVNLTGLAPDSTYEYCVGDDTDAGWLKAETFQTAPSGVVPFKFIYMGDAQNGLDAWGTLVHKAYDEEPDAAFYIMAGDLVNRGNERDDWDTFFQNAAGVFDNRQLVPAIGNHEVQGDMGPWMYLQLFDLPNNGPMNLDTAEAERAYAFEYSNALFVVLDSNFEPASQTEWLEEQLANTDAVWKIVVYHHPAYSSGANRDNPEVRELWGALFDKYHVDLALQGHDHAYLRTWPMYNEKPVDSPNEGTIYIVSVSGTKYYDQGEFDYTAFGMTNVATYQVLDIQIDGSKLTYRAHDVEGEVRDEFVIEK